MSHFEGQEEELKVLQLSTFDLVVRQSSIYIHQAAMLLDKDQLWLQEFSLQRNGFILQPLSLQSFRKRTV